MSSISGVGASGTESSAGFFPYPATIALSLQR